MKGLQRSRLPLSATPIRATIPRIISLRSISAQSTASFYIPLFNIVKFDDTVKGCLLFTEALDTAKGLVRIFSVFVPLVIGKTENRFFLLLVMRIKNDSIRINLIYNDANLLAAFILIYGMARYT